MTSKKQVLRLTQTAALLALLIVLQALTAPLGSLVTGSLTNLLLIVSVMLCGLPAGLTVACLSPVFAKLLGIGPLWGLIPFIVLGNLTLVTLWHVIAGRRRPLFYCLAVPAAAAAKFAVLYGGIVMLAVPALLHLPEPQATAVSGLFSVPQLFTAVLGGIGASLLLPLLERAVRRPEA